MTREQLEIKLDQLLEAHVESKHIDPFTDRQGLINALADIVEEEQTKSFQNGVYAGQDTDVGDLAT